MFQKLITHRYRSGGVSVVKDINNVTKWLAQILEGLVAENYHVLDYKLERTKNKVIYYLELHIHGEDK